MKKKNKEKLSILILLLSTLLLVGCTDEAMKSSTSPQTTQQITVTRAIDGDTLELSDGTKIRLIGINTPETGEPYSLEAKNFLAELTEGKTISLETDNTPEDRYGRKLRYAFIGDIFVNERLVEQGYAIHYRTDNKLHDNKLSTAEREARDNQRGIWTKSKDESCVEMTVINYDATGDDRENLNGEYVIFENWCERGLNLENWLLKDESTNSYTLPYVIMRSDDNLKIYSGSGVDTDSELFWGSSTPIWNNDYDKLLLFDDEGLLVEFHSY